MRFKISLFFCFFIFFGCIIQITPQEAIKIEQEKVFENISIRLINVLNNNEVSFDFYFNNEFLFNRNFKKNETNNFAIMGNIYELKILDLNFNRNLKDSWVLFDVNKISVVPKQAKFAPTILFKDDILEVKLNQIVHENLLEFQITCIQQNKLILIHLEKFKSINLNCFSFNDFKEYNYLLRVDDISYDLDIHKRWGIAQVNFIDKKDSFVNLKYEQEIKYENINLKFLGITNPSFKKIYSLFEITFSDNEKLFLKMYDGERKIFTNQGENYVLYLNKTIPGISLENRFAKINLKKTTQENIINQTNLLKLKEFIEFDDLKFLFSEIGLEEDYKIPVSIEVYKNQDLIDKIKLKENDSQIVKYNGNFYLLQLNDVSFGPLSNSRWIDLKIEKTRQTQLKDFNYISFLSPYVLENIKFEIIGIGKDPNYLILKAKSNSNRFEIFKIKEKTNTIINFNSRNYEIFINDIFVSLDKFSSWAKIQIIPKNIQTTTNNFIKLKINDSLDLDDLSLRIIDFSNINNLEVLANLKYKNESFNYEKYVILKENSLNRFSINNKNYEIEIMDISMDIFSNINYIDVFFKRTNIVRPKTEINQIKINETYFLDDIFIKLIDVSYNGKKQAIFQIYKANNEISKQIIQENNFSFFKVGADTYYIELQEIFLGQNNHTLVNFKFQKINYEIKNNFGIISLNKGQKIDYRGVLIEFLDISYQNPKNSKEKVILKFSSNLKEDYFLFTQNTKRTIFFNDNYFDIEIVNVANGFFKNIFIDLKIN